MTMTTDTSASAELPTVIGFMIHGNPAPLFEALAKAKGEFKPIKRTKTNPFFGSKYAELSDIIEATDAALSKNGLAVIQPECRTGDLWEIRTLLTHASGAYIETIATLPHAGDWQKVGSAMTYCRRYCHGGILGVAPEDDDDGNAAVHDEAPQQKRADGPRQNTQQRPPSPKPSIAATAPKPDRQNVIPMTEKPEAKVEPKPAAPPSQPDEAPASRESLLEIRSLLKELGFTSGPGSTGEKWCQELIGLFPSQVHSQKHADILLDDLKKRKAS